MGSYYIAFIKTTYYPPTPLFQLALKWPAHGRIIRSLRYLHNLLLQELTCTIISTVPLWCILITSTSVYNSSVVASIDITAHHIAFSIHKSCVVTQPCVSALNQHRVWLLFLPRACMRKRGLVIGFVRLSSLLSVIKNFEKSLKRAI